MRGEFEDGGGEGECHILTNLECNSVQLSTTHPTRATKQKSNKQSRKKYRKNALKKYVKREQKWNNHRTTERPHVPRRPC